MMKKKLTPEDAAAIDHNAQITGVADPRGTKTSEGITVAEAQRRAAQRNDDWYAKWSAEKQARMKAKAKPVPEATVVGESTDEGEGSETDLLPVPDENEQKS